MEKENKADEGSKVGYSKMTGPAIMCLVGILLAQTIAGAQFAWGNISPYVVGHFRDHGRDVTTDDFYSVLTTLMTTSTLLFPVG